MIFKDDLPATGATYGTPSEQNITNITNGANIDCTIIGSTLTCTANGANVTIGANTGKFDVVFSVTPTAAGNLVNPDGSGICKVDPDGNVAEDDETNNDCTDTVTISAASVGAGNLSGSSGEEDNNISSTRACGGPCSVGSAGKYCTFCPNAGINVPANTVQDGSQVVVTELVGSNASGNFQLGNSVYDIKVYGPDGQLVTSYDPPLDICIKPSNAALSAAGWNFDNLVLFHSHAGGAWNAIQNTYEKDGRLCGKVFQLSLFTLSVPELPSTGFSPGVVTVLDDQPASRLYSAMDDFRLVIPVLEVDLPIVGVPLTLEGWDVSWLGEAAGYLEGTAYPTWAGNTAITAHVWDADNTPGPFVDLHTLKHGDQIIIHAWGQDHVYEVRALSEVRPNDLSALPHSEYDVLTLITCQGFDESSGNYNWRLAIRAVLVDVETE